MTEALYFFTVSDHGGYVGAFETECEVVEHVARKYLPLTFVVQRWKRHTHSGNKQSEKNIWLVLFRDIDHIAFASDDKTEAERVQRAYAQINAVYDDDIGYWVQSLGTVSEPAQQRLDAQLRAVRTALTEEEFARMEREDQERVDRLTKPIPDGPIERYLRENERISILDFVVDTCASTCASTCADTGAITVPDDDQTAKS